MSVLLNLENFRRIIGYHPFHFWQLANEDVPVTSNCNTIVRQYSWQNADAGGREDVLEAIEHAESSMAELLGFWPKPRWKEKIIQYPRYLDNGVWWLTHAGGDGRWMDVKLPEEGFVQSLGPVSSTLLGSQALTFSDEDGDGLDDTFTTASVATSETDEDNIAVYFKTADRLDDDLEKWRILPVEVTISGGNVVVTGKRWQVVRPILYEGVSSNQIDPSVDANFSDELEIYVRKTNVSGTDEDSAQALLIWESNPYPEWAVCCGSDSVTDSSTDPAAEAYGIARAGIRNGDVGLVNVGRSAYNATTGVWSVINWGICRPPDRVKIRYYAGFPLENGDMAKKMQVAVARLACAEMIHRICACETANRELHRWQKDLSRSHPAEEYPYFSPELLNNPLGTRRGHVYAWQFINEFRNLEGMVV